MKGSWGVAVQIVVLLGFLAAGGLIWWQGFPALTSQKTSAAEAKYWMKIGDSTVQCQLCFRKCLIPPGRRGYCGARENRDGKLYTMVYGKPCSVTLDEPIEKLPLYHVQPGSLRLCLATTGCNFQCNFCQNWEISACLPEEANHQDLSAEQVVTLALNHGLEFIAFTYTEPTIFYEYMYDVSVAAKERGLKTVIHTNGAMNPEPLQALLKYTDAVTVDLKAFTSEFYQVTSFSELEPVLRTLKLLKEERKWFEMVNLVIPTLNDDLDQVREMCCWIRDNLGDEVPIHFNRFFPAYKLTRLPPTPVETLEKARKIALEQGLKYVYIGNVPGHPANSTYCPRCGKEVVGRAGLVVSQVSLENGRCKFCGYYIPGIWG